MSWLHINGYYQRPGNSAIAASYWLKDADMESNVDELIPSEYIPPEATSGYIVTRREMVDELPFHILGVEDDKIGRFVTWYK